MPLKVVPKSRATTSWSSESASAFFPTNAVDAAESKPDPRPDLKKRNSSDLMLYYGEGVGLLRVVDLDLVRGESLPRLKDKFAKNFRACEVSHCTSTHPLAAFGAELSKIVGRRVVVQVPRQLEQRKISWTLEKVQLPAWGQVLPCNPGTYAGK